MGDATLPVVLKHVSRRGEEVVCGFEFEGMQPRDYYALADLMYGDADALGRFLESRRAHKDLFSGTAQFLTWGVTEPVRAFSYLFKRAAPSSAAAPAPAAAEPAAPVAVETAAMAVAAPDAKPLEAEAAAAAPQAAEVQAGSAASQPAEVAASPPATVALSAEWLRQLIDMAHWEVRRAENMNRIAADDARGDAGQEVARADRAA